MYVLRITTILTLQLTPWIFNVDTDSWLGCRLLSEFFQASANDRHYE